jgi:hypothetical protein
VASHGINRLHVICEQIDLGLVKPGEEPTLEKLVHVKKRWQKCKFGKKEKEKKMAIERLLRKFLPAGTLEDFTITDFQEDGSVEAFGETYYIELTEKKYIPSGFEGKQVRQKGYRNKRVLDFPIRGRKTVLVYRRRKWQVEDEPGIYMRPLTITAAGVKLSPEFAFFFTEEDRESGT